MTIATTPSTARRSVLHHAPETSIGISRDCRGSAGARPDRVAPQMVAFPFLVAHDDAVGGYLVSNCVSIRY